MARSRRCVTWTGLLVGSPLLCLVLVGRAAADEILFLNGDRLSGKITGERYQRLTPADRQAIGEILRDTKPDFAPYAAPYVAAGL